jgi:hypothetical protein
MEMETLFRLKVDSLLMTASWVDRLRHELGLLGASQVWGDRPAWYIWLADSPGAYQMEIVETSDGADEDSGLARALVALKFYPRPDSGFFGHFSPQERALMQNGCIDHTGTPFFEKLGEIPPHLFSIGSLELACQPGQDWMIFSLAALDLCREVRLARPGPAKDMLSEVVVRRAPGWELAYALFNKLLSLWAFQSKQTPSRIQLATESGFEMLSGLSDLPPIREARDINLQNMWVLFCADSDRPPAEALRHLDSELAEPQREEMCNLHFTCRHFHHLEPQVKASALIKEDWWTLAQAEYQSERCNSCGCNH